MATLMKEARNTIMRRPLLFSSSLTSHLSLTYCLFSSSTSAPNAINAVASTAAVRLISPAISMTVDTPGFLQPRVVVYDGVCHLCHNGVKWIIKADKYKKIKFCCLQSKAAEPYMRMCGVDKEDVLRRFLFIEGQGSYYQGSSDNTKTIEGSCL